MQWGEKVKKPVLSERNGAGKDVEIACVWRGERAARSGRGGGDRDPPLALRALVGAGARGSLGLAHMARP